MIRKITTCLFILLCSLTVVGQPEQELNIESVRNAITEFNTSKSEVVTQASKRGYGTQKELDSTLNHTFQSILYIADNIEKVKDNPKFSQSTAEDINAFIGEYRLAISVSADDPKIGIGSKKFLDVVQFFSPKFDSINEQIKAKLADKKNPDGDKAGVTDPSEDKSESNEEVAEESSNIWIWCWRVLILLGVIGLILGCIGLLLFKNVYSRIKELEQECDSLKRNYSHDMQEMRERLNRINRSNYSQTPKSYGYYSEAPKQPSPVKENTIKKSPEKKEKRESSQPKVISTEICLYASIDALSPIPEFKKVSNVESENKIFMLKLRTADDNIATYDMAPNISQDRLKAVIADRNTYLPSTFCEIVGVSGSPTRITVVELGTAKKNAEGKWLVGTRMKLKLD